MDNDESETANGSSASVPLLLRFNVSDRAISRAIWLMFWGHIILCVHFRTDGFDIFNDFIGHSMILWGTIALSRVKISDRYRRLMLFVVTFSLVVTIQSLLSDVLQPLRIIRLPSLLPPTALALIAVWICLLVFCLALFAFLRCMREFCSALYWKHARDSWKRTSSYMAYASAFIFVCMILYSAVFCRWNGVPYRMTPKFRPHPAAVILNIK